MASYGPGGVPRKRGAALQTVVVVAVIAAVCVGVYFAMRRGQSGGPAAPAAPAGGEAGGGRPATGQTAGPAGGTEVKLPPTEADIPGKDEFRRGEYAKAAARLADHVTRNPKDAAAQYLLGRSCLETGKPAEAEAALARAVELDPSGPTGGAAALCLGDILYDRHYARAEDQDRTRWERVRALYSAALRISGSGPEREQLVKRLNALNEHLIWSRLLTADSELHSVAAGETVERIAVKYGLPRDCAASISRINKLKEDRISINQQLKVIRPLKMELFVNKTHLKLTAFLNGYFFGEYPVGIGKGGATPVGEFAISVAGKDRNPDWTQTLPDGSRKLHKFGELENILGTRWMRIDDRPEMGAIGLGIHGTTDPKSVPGRESAGCVRMLNPDVELLYDFTPDGTKVTVVN